MTRTEFLKYHSEFVNRMHAICEKKNHDYTSCTKDDDAFANFKAVETLGFCSVEQGFLARITDKLTRMGTFVRKGSYEVEDETIEDTLMDACNYLILMSGYIKDKKAKWKKFAAPPETV